MQNLKTTFFAFLMFVSFHGFSQTKEKCFSNAGLKSSTTIKIKFEANNQISGVVTTDDYEGTETNSSFTGTIQNGVIQPVFEKKKPSIGDGSEWTNKPWSIKKGKSGEMLVIIFNSKDYQTGKWSETPYVLDACQ